MGGRPVRPELDAVFARLYEAAALPEVWPEALQMFADLMGSRGTLLTRADRNHQGLVHSPGIAESVSAFFEGGWQNRDLRTERVLRSGRFDNFTCDQQIITPEAMRSSEYYNAFARPADVPWFATGGILTSEVALGLSLQRTARQGAFSTGEVARLDQMLPRLKHVLNVAYRLAGVQERRLIQDLAGLHDGIVLLDPSGREVECNAAAEACYGDGLVRGVAGPEARDPAAHQALRRLIEGVCGPTACPTASVTIPRVSRPPLKVQAIRLVGRTRDLFGRARALLIISGSGDETNEARLRVLFGLTPAEARVAGLLLAGQDVTAIADTLDLSRETVRFHLKSILPKAGVRRQAEFILRAVGLLEARN